MHSLNDVTFTKFRAPLSKPGKGKLMPAKPFYEMKNILEKKNLRSLENWHSLLFDDPLNNKIYNIWK